MAYATFGSGKQLFLICLSVSVQVWPYPTESNMYKNGDKKIGRREGTQPIKRVLTYVLFSVTHSVQGSKMV